MAESTEEIVGRAFRPLTPEQRLANLEKNMQAVRVRRTRKTMALVAAGGRTFDPASYEPGTRLHKLAAAAAEDDRWLRRWEPLRQRLAAETRSVATNAAIIKEYLACRESKKGMVVK